MSGNLEEFNKKQEKERKKKRRKKEILIFFILIICVVILYAITVKVKQHNVEKLGSDYCQYNGEHPIETGMKSETRATCKGCSKIMKFEYKITDELCETCALELYRCKKCGKLLEN